MKISKWKKLGIDTAALMSGLSKDPSTKVGASIMRDKFIVSAGYNGPPAGVRDIERTREERLAITLHAELNAILSAKQDLTGCTIYVTHICCAACAAVIIQAGIERVVYPRPDSDFTERWQFEIGLAAEMFADAGVYVDEY